MLAIHDRLAGTTVTGPLRCRSALPDPLSRCTPSVVLLYAPSPCLLPLPLRAINTNPVATKTLNRPANPIWYATCLP